MKSPEYQDALANSKATITKESGTAAVKMRDDAVEALKGFNESFKAQRDAVDSTVKFMEERLSVKGIELPVKKSKGSDKPPPPPPGAKLD
jgi:preprotein translocase subunit SecD